MGVSMVAKLFDTFAIKDLIERSAATSIQSAVAVLATCAATDIDLSFVVGALVTGIAAGLSVIKGAIASQMGDRSASLLNDLQISRDPSTGRFTSRRVTAQYSEEEIKQNGD